VGGDAGDAAAVAEEDRGGGAGEQRRGGADGGHGVGDLRVEDGAVGPGGEPDVADDALAQGGVGAHLQAALEERVADEPDGEEVAAIEIEVKEGSERAEGVVVEQVGVVDEEDGLDAALVDELGGGRGVGEVEDAVGGARELSAQVTQGAGLPDAGLAGQDGEARLGGEPVEDAGEAAQGVVGEEVLAGGAARSAGVDSWLVLLAVIVLVGEAEAGLVGAHEEFERVDAGRDELLRAGFWDRFAGAGAVGVAVEPDGVGLEAAIDVDLRRRVRVHRAPGPDTEAIRVSSRMPSTGQAPPRSDRSACQRSPRRPTVDGTRNRAPTSAFGRPSTRSVNVTRASVAFRDDALHPRSNDPAGGALALNGVPPARCTPPTRRSASTRGSARSCCRSAFSAHPRR
jgi:hypothetical protein